jgi:hypothetical protein
MSAERDEFVSGIRLGNGGAVAIDGFRRYPDAIARQTDHALHESLAPIARVTKHDDIPARRLNAWKNASEDAVPNQKRVLHSAAWNHERPNEKKRQSKQAADRNPAENQTAGGSGRSKRSTRHEEQKYENQIEPDGERELRYGHRACARGKQHNRQLRQLEESETVCAPNPFAQNAYASD